MDDEIAYVKVAHVEPGDVLVLHVPREVSSFEADRLRTSVEARFPGHKAMVVAAGARLDVRRPTVRSDWRLFLVHAGVTGLLLSLVGLTGWAFAVVAGLVFVTLVWSPNR